jgi:SAM-dependent methyltransferase
MVPGYSALHRVTSDCKPWPQGGRLGVCPQCGCVQKATDAVWQAEIQKIYHEYEIYHQSAGIEQSVFTGDTGQASSRSTHLLERLRTRTTLPDKGRLLDIGCGNGALLRAFSKIAPGWTLEGTELSDKYRSVVESIPGVIKLHTCEPNDVPGRFQLITMIHVLEHIPTPTGYLIQFANKFEPGGRLVVEVPDHLQNPFDLLIADHSTHFSATTLARVVGMAGYTVQSVATDWVPKELSLVATQGPAAPIGAVSPTGLEAVVRRVKWIESVAETARPMAAAGNFGLFGTSIAATWLCAELGDQISFFVDEATERIGRNYRGHPVFHPRNIPAGARIYIALAPQQAQNVKARLQQAWPGYDWVTPPPLLDR